MTKLEQQKFVCLDCETTGLDTDNDRIIEIAAVKFDLTMNYESIQSLVNPECPIPKESTAIHHITQEMVAGQPLIGAVLPQILEFVGKNILVGHGIGFDMLIVDNEAKRLGIPSSLRYNRYIDTLRLARLYGGSPINSLEHLRKHFNVEQDVAHRAMSDVVVNIEVFKHLVKSFSTLEKIFDVLSRPILLKEMPLGKHKGRPFKEIPIEYLQWAANKDFDQDLLFSVRSEIKRRKKGDLFSQAGNPFNEL